MRRVVILTVAIVTAAVLGVPAGAQSSGNLAVLAVCNTEPESTAILNNTDEPVTLLSLSSIKDPQPYEPIAINQELPPGEVVTFYLGPTSPAPSLSPLRIYDNTAPDEGAILQTSIGIVTALCGSGAGSLVGLGSNVGVAPTPVPEPTSPPLLSPIRPPNTGDAGLR